MNSSVAHPHPEEPHRSQRSPWLRAAVLGVNDGLVSTSSLMLGVLASNASDSAILTAGIAGLAAGAMSMAAGEYVSVSSQRDSERADIAIERRSLERNPEGELAELAEIYERRGVEPALAKKVAQQLHAHDAVGAHVRDELGIDHEDLSKPGQASFASAVSFSIGALVPIIAALLAPHGASGWVIVVASMMALAISGAVGAYIGGGHRVVAALRVFIGGGLAMAVTALIGHFIGSVV
ncbi:MAG TPA: VIT family protein [Candidatus Saccharimonadales bacterium]|nr:VIT family protein [Candidatus Saccharimonadales bacterium]